jgi:hypothetical protein
MACDNVKNFEVYPSLLVLVTFSSLGSQVVLADARIVNANVQKNPDLFRALKGGGPNFGSYGNSFPKSHWTNKYLFQTGIVTRFDLYTYPDYRVWYTFKVYSCEDSAKVMDAAVQVQQVMDIDDRVGFFLSLNGGVFIAGMIYLGWAESQPLHIAYLTPYHL